MTWKVSAKAFYNKGCLVQDRLTSTASITQTCCQRVCSTNDALVVEASSPDLTWHEATAKDTNEEAQCVQLLNVEGCTREERWDDSD